MKRFAALLTYSMLVSPGWAATVSGTITSLGGEACAYANVTLVGGSVAVLADESGAYSIHNVAPGEYLIQVRQVACRPWEGALTVDKADKVSFDISLPCPSLEKEREQVRFFAAPSAETVGIMESATRVLTFAVNPFLYPLVDDADPSLGFMGEFQLISAGTTLVGSSARTACEVLLSEESYRFDYSDRHGLARVLWTRT